MTEINMQIHKIYTEKPDLDEEMLYVISLGPIQSPTLTTRGRRKECLINLMMKGVLQNSETKYNCGRKITEELLREHSAL